MEEGIVAERHRELVSICEHFGKANRPSRASTTQESKDNSVDFRSQSDDENSDAAVREVVSADEVSRLFHMDEAFSRAIVSSAPLAEVRACAAAATSAAAEQSTPAAADGKAPPFAKLWSVASSAIGSDMSRTAKYGRWLPEDRYSLGQVPCMLVEGDTRTYHFKGANEHVWVAGSGKGDEGKRFCTLQLIVRFKNGDKTKMFAGQPWPEICFRGQGIRITQKEKDAWEPGVHVRFQPKAWYCEATCLKHATERLPAITASARSAHRESVLIVDNLHGQTTPEYINMCWVRSKMKVHLLPARWRDRHAAIDWRWVRVLGQVLHGRVSF